MNSNEGLLASRACIERIFSSTEADISPIDHEYATIFDFGPRCRVWALSKTAGGCIWSVVFICYLGAASSSAEWTSYSDLLTWRPSLNRMNCFLRSRPCDRLFPSSKCMCNHWQCFVKVFPLSIIGIFATNRTSYIYCI